MAQPNRGSDSPAARLPLAGLVVVSVEHAIAAPMASRHLADLGARVIKVERPDGGDFARAYDTTVKGLSSHFAWVNRSKESVALDLKSEQGKETMRALLGRADVFLHNLAPGGMDRLGFGAEAVRAERPELIVCEISGYGGDGPYRDKKAYDLLIQCEAGVVSLTGTPEAPAKAGIPVADIAAAMYAFSGILGALVRRDRTGEGAALQISMLEALGEWVGYPLLYSRYGGTQPPRTGASHAAIAPYGPFPTAGGEEVFLAIQNGREWERFCATVLGDAALAADGRFASGDARIANRAELDARIAVTTAALSSAELVARLEEAGIANANLRDMAQLAAHPQLAALERWAKVGSPAGEVEVLLPPLDYGVPPRLGPIPALGADTAAIEAELGIDGAGAPSADADADAGKLVYDFEEGSREQRDLLGGKGANVAEMIRVLGAERVPAGFTIATPACVAYLRDGGEMPAGLEEQVAEALERLERRAGKRLGDPADPLLVSVRSGARDSMPGMLDTVLNLGLGDAAVEGLIAATGDERFGWDSYRRFVQMFGNVCRGIPGEDFERLLAEARREAGAGTDAELPASALRELTGRFKRLYAERTGEPFPEDPALQLRAAIAAVFDSWRGERAVHYRRINGIPDEWGTAVNVQQMVFGNRGEGSCSGVAFSRDEITGAPEPSGDFLPNAQGEDVVSGVRTPLDLAALHDSMPGVHAELLATLATLERHYGDMQDTEFTVEAGRLYMLQTRAAKRPAQAAVRFAVDAVAEGLLDEAAALATIDAGQLDALLHPTLDPEAEFEDFATGVAASPGAARGAVVFSAEEAVAVAAGGGTPILVRPFTEAEDVAGFHVAAGILTAEGGKASHAALVARGMGKPCVAGAGELEIDLEARTVSARGVTLKAGEEITIDGSRGRVTVEAVPLREAELGPELRQVLEWADRLRGLRVRANADTPADAVRARELGAEGIGLCRTEHMFMAPERAPLMRAMVMAAGEEERRAALAELLPMQQTDFEAIFEAMAGLPVTVRLLDPPLHEFLPRATDLVREIERARAAGEAAEVERLEPLLERVEALAEANPMLGTRGVRLGFLNREIYEMQARAVVRAARAVAARSGAAPELQLMIPLVAYEAELEAMRELVERVAAEERNEARLNVGTMIELPRACLVADRIAASADFFSFGTNDLTQTALGFSRDDVEAEIVDRYVAEGVLDRSPFETIDRPGVGRLVEIAAAAGRRARPEIELGVCGEHGGDPDSVAFFAAAGMDYVSCSPFRVPIARLAAAQAAIRG